ncbi:MAG: phosphoribosylformylglycinamidine synthase [Fretibacterium sp.]|nr:phosphoribosylformylglycinamidine synthase [Fretibacterium sp.]
MVHRLYVERRPAFAQEAASLCSELRNLLGLSGLERVRIVNRYDVEGLDGGALDACRAAVFADPCTDALLDRLPEDAACVLAAEYLPGQYDQRADAAEQCIGLLTGQRPVVRTARVYLFYGRISEEDLGAVKKHLINPVECREAQLGEYETLNIPCPDPGEVPVLRGFRDRDEAGLDDLREDLCLAMSVDDLRYCQVHFEDEGRDPTLTELRVLDTYWSDHCRHTTFLTAIDSIDFEDEKVRAAYDRYLALREELNHYGEPVTLMDMATIGARVLKKRGQLPDLVDSDEVNACTVRVSLDVTDKDENVKTEPWLLLFKNETHNHPTEIEPFGGAATCIGGAIRDPLSGRGYVYQAMRLTGAADPRKPIGETLQGKLPQRVITTRAAEGYSSYGNQIGIPTGLVDEIYHEGYAAKRMEVGAVIAAVPEASVRRESPKPGDCVLLLGGRTGRDGCGGATGSSRAHNARSLETCGAEVQKGNAPEERKLQRLFRNADFSLKVKRCNDFGAGGVSVAVGELAEGLDIDLDVVPLKYAGLSGTEIAISESQERMAVVVAEADVPEVMRLAEEEDVAATVVARVTDSGRIRMSWRGENIVDIPRAFIQSNGAERHTNVMVSRQKEEAPGRLPSFAEGLRSVVTNLNVCSRRGLGERFDSTVGANSVLMPFGGLHQRTPVQAMAAKFPLMRGETNNCSVMTWGFDPFISSDSPYEGAYLAVVESLCRLAAAGVDLKKCWLTFQEYFGKPGNDPRRWGLPAAALLGALDAQMDFGVAAIGGKDSMSGSFENLDVPPTLISFGVGLANADCVVSPGFKGLNSRVVLLRPRYSGRLPEAGSMRSLLGYVQTLIANSEVLSAASPTFGGAAAMLFKMCLGKGVGFDFNENVSRADLFVENRGAFILEVFNITELDVPEDVELIDLGYTREDPVMSRHGNAVKMSELEELYEETLEEIFPVNAPAGDSLCRPLPAARENLPGASCPPVGAARPRFLIPVFPGTNCEYESVRAVERAGGEAELLVVRTSAPEAMRASAERFAERLDEAQALFLPGGFSNGDEPDGSGKFIAIFLRSPAVRAAVGRLLDERGGLACGICNGFQALLRTGLIPFGRIVDMEELNGDSAALTFNTIGRHQSKLVRVRILSNRSPWLSRTKVGDICTVPISHGEGRFVCGEKLLNQMAEAGQVAAQYVDLTGQPTMEVQFNPNGSLAAIECLTSPDGRVLGRMGHAERVGSSLYRNVESAGDMGMFEAAVDFLKA